MALAMGQSRFKPDMREENDEGERVENMRERRRIEKPALPYTLDVIYSEAILKNINENEKERRDRTWRIFAFHGNEGTKSRPSPFVDARVGSKSRLIAELTSRYFQVKAAFDVGGKPFPAERRKVVASSEQVSVVPYISLLSSFSPSIDRNHLKCLHCRDRRNNGKPRRNSSEQLHPRKLKLSRRATRLHFQVSKSSFGLSDRRFNLIKIRSKSGQTRSTEEKYAPKKIGEVLPAASDSAGISILDFASSTPRYLKSSEEKMHAWPDSGRLEENGTGE
ncbi:hypothetical protein V1478_011700 [Vespula squamosa]|uniref:Uncharacterized protein n=1 Tax=Vespula squamosa TaxID=30214 RepID=A0ABD2AB24_VESSQ